VFKFLKTLWDDESGIAAVEYTLLLAVVGAAIIIGATFLGDEIGKSLTKTADCIKAGTACVP